MNSLRIVSQVLSSAVPDLKTCWSLDQFWAFLDQAPA